MEIKVKVGQSGPSIFTFHSSSLTLLSLPCQFASTPHPFNLIPSTRNRHADFAIYRTGNFYSITNQSPDKSARLFFAQGCEVNPETAFDESAAA